MRRGFTLVELLLALSLSATLGIGIVTAFEQGRRAEAQATAEADARQVGRLALEWIARDVQSLVKTASAFNPGLQGSDYEHEARPVDIVLCTTTSNLPAWRELTDTPEAAQLNPFAAASAAFGMAPAITAPDSDVLQLEYYVGVDLDQDPPGLIRRTRPIPTVETTAEDGGYTKLSLAREVLGLDCKYWDGAEWLDTWDSAQSATYPRAIQVTVTVRVGRLPEDLTEPIPTRAFTRTIVLVAEPFVASDPDAQPASGGVR